MTSRGKLGAAAAMMAAAVVLGGCGSGDGGKDGGEDGAGTGSTPTATAIPGAGTEAVNSAPPAKLTGRRVRRSGFSIPLPAGYRDATDSKVLANAPVRPDLLLQGARSGGVTTNVNVVRVKVPTVSLTQVIDAERRQRAALGARFRGANRTLDLGGEPAASFAYQAAPSQGDYLQRQVFALRHGREVVVTLTASAQAFDDGERVLEAVVDGWRWR